ncbi:MAG: RIP metalloprotease RseP [Sphingomonadales bacterium 32-68-7]|nr:MAG: RIP metalloprotease RseP [Sphingomonadales bacterium 12-68-11]OYX09256.1 MAG: RIP metalloprotease RseP [Sphingomonadales bacterium 32-68-7]
MYIAGFLLLLGPLVTVHELGHYLVGRWFGVKADAFSVGFGKELAGWTDRRGTRWKLSALPLGGYVQFAGDMNPASQPSEAWLNLPEHERQQTFQAKPLWQRALIVLAGPMTNLLVAIAIFAGYAMVYGKPAVPPVVQVVTENSAAAAAGIQVGDRIVAIDGQPIAGFDDISNFVLPYPGKTIAVTYTREGETSTVPVKVADREMVDRFGNKARIGLIGVGSNDVTFESVGPLGATAFAVQSSVRVVQMTLTGLGQILTGQRSVDELGGPIKIAKFSGEKLSLGPLAFIEFAALISINLAFINLLPIPALDGGHLAFYAAEAVRRKPLGPRSQEWAFRTGIAFVLALMLFVTINDIASLPIFGG